MIINKKIDDAIQTLKCFEKENQLYWISKLNLKDSEKGFICFYLGLLEVL